VCTEDPEEQEKMVIGIVKLMKTFSNEWNNDNVDGDTLLTNIKHMAGNKLVVDFEKLKAKHIFSTVNKERNRGFSVNIPEPKRNNMIQRITKK
jgi:hypothetical protein